MPLTSNSLQQRFILGTRIDVANYCDATRRVLSWAQAGEHRYVCIATVNNVMESYDSPGYRSVVNCADLVVSDGMPLVWVLKLMGIRDATRVYGPDLMLSTCDAAASLGVPIALYGGSPETLDKLINFLKQRNPSIHVACHIAPPFRSLTAAEDEAYTQEITLSGARIVFVGTGCPRQEKWMAVHKHRIAATTIGVGAAFDFHSGRIRQAPRWMMRIGMEWLFRLWMEPRRLWKRNLRHNPRFLILVFVQILRDLLTKSLQNKDQYWNG